LDAGDYDAIILASAGLIRLGMAARIRQSIPAAESLPAAGQGAVGIELRSDDSDVLALLRVLHHEPSWRRVTAERALIRRLQGGCEVPIAGYAQYDESGENLWLRGLVGKPDGSLLLRAEAIAPASGAEQLGEAVAEDLLTQGAAAILAEVYGS
jgi:hydroxymethylbilane synthase